ncbi:hypothetical protein ACRAWG_31430 [Methylobacterium sp. P31]
MTRAALRRLTAPESRAAKGGRPGAGGRRIRDPERRSEGRQLGADHVALGARCEQLLADRRDSGLDLGADVSLDGIDSGAHASERGAPERGQQVKEGRQDWHGLSGG